jgi:hypothetical protein
MLAAHRARRLAAAIGAMLVFGGCGSPGPSRLACTTPAEGLEIVDQDLGLRVCLPPNWRRLLAGDPGWSILYGGPDSPTERSVLDGSIPLFAVPLEPRELDVFVNLAIYVQDVGSETTLAKVARTYEDQFDRLEPKATDIVWDDVTLPAGSAVRLAGTRPKTPASDRLVVYIVVSGDRAYYLDYVSGVDTADHYADIFLQSANSLVFVPSAGQSP